MNPPLLGGERAGEKTLDCTVETRDVFYLSREQQQLSAPLLFACAETAFLTMMLSFEAKGSSRQQCQRYTVIMCCGMFSGFQGDDDSSHGNNQSSLFFLGRELYKNWNTGACCT